MKSAEGRDSAKRRDFASVRGRDLARGGKGAPAKGGDEGITTGAAHKADAARNARVTKPLSHYLTTKAKSGNRRGRCAWVGRLALTRRVTNRLPTLTNCVKKSGHGCTQKLSLSATSCSSCRWRGIFFTCNFRHTHCSMNGSDRHDLVKRFSLSA